MGPTETEWQFTGGLTFRVYSQQEVHTGSALSDKAANFGRFDLDEHANDAIMQHLLSFPTLKDLSVTTIIGSRDNLIYLVFEA